MDSGRIKREKRILPVFYLNLQKFLFAKVFAPKVSQIIYIRNELNSCIKYKLMSYNILVTLSCKPCFVI